MQDNGPARTATGTFAAECRRLGPRLMRDLGLTDVQAAGLAQWTGPRRAAMEAWCRAHALDPAAPEASYRYLCVELRTSEAAALEALRRTTTLEAATGAVCRRFERPGILALPSRLIWAGWALAVLRGGDDPASAARRPG
jgi:Phage tail lysozyme